MKQVVVVQTIYRDAGKPNAAAPVTNGCALPGAAMQGEPTDSPIQIKPAITGVFSIAAEIRVAEISFTAPHDNLWGPGADGTSGWRNQADGVFE